VAQVNATGIVTGEGVVLEAEAASLPTRMLSALIDYTLYAVLLAVALSVWWILVFFRLVSDNVGAALAVTLVVLILVGLPVTIETLTRGLSLGRLALGIRIVRDDGGAITLRHAVIRALLAVVEIWMASGALALIASLFNSKGKRLGDLLAGTYAIRVRGGPRDRLTVTMPHHLVGWAATSDVSRLPDHLGLAVRQFLGRVDKLNPESRVKFGTELTEQVQLYVRPSPPPGTHPEHFLLAVLAERRTREARAEAGRRVRTRAEADITSRLPFGVPDQVDQPYAWS
jgi:uncharacterized RDD family membrane protein YckC